MKIRNFSLAMVIIAIFTVAFAACPNPTKVTKTVTVLAINNPIIDPLDFGTVESLTGWDADFPSSDVTYTLTLSQGGIVKKTVISTSSTSISGYGLGDGQYTITQTFSYKGSPVSGGSRSAGVVIAANIIGGIIVDENTPAAGSLPAITLHLVKYE